MMRKGRSARQACACSHSSRFSIANPMVSGYMNVLPGPVTSPFPPSRPPPAARLPLPGAGAAGRHGGHGGSAPLAGWPCSAAAPIAHRNRSTGGCTGTGPVISIPGWRMRRVAVGRQEGLGYFSSGSGWPAGMRPHDLGGHDHQQLVVAAVDRLGSGTACPAAECCRGPGLWRSSRWSGCRSARRSRSSGRSSSSISVCTRRVDRAGMVKP